VGAASKCRSKSSCQSCCVLCVCQIVGQDGCAELPLREAVKEDNLKSVYPSAPPIKFVHWRKQKAEWNGTGLTTTYSTSDRSILFTI
jgi:hypothetical protein